MSVVLSILAIAAAWAITVVDEAAPPRWLLPIPDTCAALGVGRSTVYELAGRGDIEIVRIGRRALVPVSSVEAYVERLRAGQPEPAT